MSGSPPGSFYSQNLTSFPQDMMVTEECEEKIMSHAQWGKLEDFSFVVH